MMRQEHPFQSFARLLSYPWPGEGTGVAAALDRVAAAYPEERATISPFWDFVRDSSEEKLQELYTRTFEVQPICYLDVGYVLFGEDYKRGQFLVHLNREHQNVQNPCGTELPDHLPNLLRLLAKLKDADFAAELSRVFLIPALEKMLSGFRENGNVYGGALQALSRVLKREYLPNVREPELEQGALL